MKSVFYHITLKSYEFTDQADNNISDRFCHVCGIDLKYPSKLSRHLQSKSHKMFEANLLSQDLYLLEHCDVNSVDAVSYIGSDTLAYTQTFKIYF